MISHETPGSIHPKTQRNIPEELNFGQSLSNNFKEGVPLFSISNNESDLQNVGRGKVQPRTSHEGSEVEKRYRSTLSLTSALDGLGGQHHSPAALPPEKPRYPSYRRLDGP